MNEPEDRKSMDDVLASIRRIVRAEKDPEEAGDVSEAPGSGLSTPPEAEDMPLELTPDMRTDADSEPDVAPDSTPLDAIVAATAVPEPQTPAMDDASLRQIVRDVVMEQLAGEAGSDLVRGIIRDELVNGEIGSNISQNVMALIQQEVSKAASS